MMRSVPHHQNPKADTEQRDQLVPLVDQEVRPEMNQALGELPVKAHSAISVALSGVPAASLMIVILA